MSTAFATRFLRGADGFVQVSGDQADVASVELLLATEPGDLLNDQVQGVAVLDLLLLLESAARSVLDHRIREQFQTYLPRLILQDISAVKTADGFSLTVLFRRAPIGTTQTATVSRA